MSEWGNWMGDTSPKCPWCGEDISDDIWMDCNEGHNELECGECAQPVIVELVISRDFRAKKQEPQS